MIDIGFVLYSLTRSFGGGTYEEDEEDKEEIDK